MDSNFYNESNNEYPIYFYIHLFFVFVGFLIYLIALILFQMCFNQISYIKKEIFTFIIINSFKCFLEIVLFPSMIKEYIIYVFGIVEFYLIMTYINKSLTSQIISENSQIYELEYRYYIIIAFIVCSFPYEKTFNLTEKYAFSYDTIIIALAILLFRYINIKIQLLLDYLKEKKMTNYEIPDFYLSYNQANYYYTNFNIINIIFCITLVLVITYNVIKILGLFFEWKELFIYLIILCEDFIYCSLIAGCLIFFFSLNRNNLTEKGKIENEEEVNISKLSVVDVDIQQDENNNNSKRKKKDKKKQIKLDKQIDNKDEINENENTNIKVSEENEKLK